MHACSNIRAERQNGGYKIDGNADKTGIMAGWGEKGRERERGGKRGGIEGECILCASCFDDEMD